MNLSEHRSGCPLNVAVELFGDKWSLLLLRDVLVLGKCRYGEFLDSPEGISTNILASRLKHLEQSGLLEKLSDPRNRKVNVYLPTPLGISLLPVVLEVIRWGTEYLPNTGVPDFVSKAFRDGPEDLIAQCEARVDQQRSALAAQ